MSKLTKMSDARIAFKHAQQHNRTVADQCRALGLEVGDTIEGTERCGGWWNTTRLTLLWLGETEAAWRVTDRSSSRPNWSEPREAANWTLRCRDWRRVGAGGAK
jgi:hypothetical protein